MGTSLAPGETGADAVVLGNDAKGPAKHFGYIDAMRGYAILAVMAVHAASVAPDLEGIGRTLVNQGARGVQLFFVASALTLMMSWHARNDGAARFYIRRIFRIAPMFWLGSFFFFGVTDGGRGILRPTGLDRSM